MTSATATATVPTRRPGRRRNHPGPAAPSRLGAGAAVSALSVLLLSFLWAPASLADTPDRIRRLVQNFQAAGRARVGVSVVEIGSGRALVGIDDTQRYVPASNQKILTAAAALAELGGAFRFTTTVYWQAGNVVIVGDFDPTLGDPVLARAAGRSIYAELDHWAAAIARKSGGEVPGDILLIGRTHPRADHHPQWPERMHRHAYAARVGELNFHNNCFDVTFAVADGQARPIVSPLAAGRSLTTSLSIGGRHIWSLRTNEDESELTVSGTIRRATAEPYSVPAKRPDLLLGRALLARLDHAGVRVTGGLRVLRAAQPEALGAMEPIYRTMTPISEVLTRSHKNSLNMAAEALMLRTGDGTWEGSAREVAAILHRHYDLPSGAIRVVDGSGLASGNQCSPQAMTTVLTRLMRYRDAGMFLRSLPVSGIDGSLARRMGRTDAKGRVLAKTGTLARASSLSGYILDGSRRPVLAFSVLCDAMSPGRVGQARNLQDAICRELVAFVDQCGDTRYAGRGDPRLDLRVDVRAQRPASPRPMDRAPENRHADSADQ